MAFKKPDSIALGTKFLFFGGAGTRKTRTALTFPKLAYIDTDQSADSYLEEFKDNISIYSDSTTYAEVIDDLNEIQNHLDEISTIVIDSDTKIYENQQHAALKVAEQRAIKNRRLKEGEGLSPKEYQIIRLRHDQMLAKAFEYKKDSKDIIVICESKDQKEMVSDGNGGMVYKTVGTVPNTDKGVEYDFDVVLEFLKDDDGKFIGAKVHKDRLGVTEEGEIIENPSYEIWKDALERKKKGKVKAEKRDFEKDIKSDASTFYADSETVEIQKTIDAISDIIDELDDDKKKELSTMLKEKFKTSKYREVTDIKILKEMFEVAESIKNK